MAEEVAGSVNATDPSMSKTMSESMEEAQEKAMLENIKN